MRTRSKTSLNVYSLKLYHSFVKASSIDSSPLFIISAIRSARSFANGCEKHLLRTMDFLTPSKKWGINDNWEPPLVIFLFFQFLLFFPQTYLVAWWCLHQNDFDTLHTLSALIRDGCRSISRWKCRSFQACWCRSMVTGGADRCCFCWALIDFIS